MNLSFDVLAKKEFEDAIEYYDLEIEGLGKSFRDEVIKALGNIKRFPQTPKKASFPSALGLSLTPMHLQRGALGALYLPDTGSSIGKLDA